MSEISFNGAALIQGGRPGFRDEFQSKLIASMGPPLFRAEGVGNCGGDYIIGMASMGPPLFRAEGLPPDAAADDAA